jgi:hypothetical protein
VRYYEIHLHQPLGPVLFGFLQPQYTVCTAFLEDEEEGCTGCGQVTKLTTT